MQEPIQTTTTPEASPDDEMARIAAAWAAIEGLSHDGVERAIVYLSSRATWLAEAKREALVAARKGTPR